MEDHDTTRGEDVSQLDQSYEIHEGSALMVTISEASGFQFTFIC